MSSMRTLELYAAPWSPPCTTVQFFTAILNLRVKTILTVPGNGDTETEEFRQINPQHTIPIIKDDGFVLSESRAILRYIAQKYPDDSGPFSSQHMYPKDDFQKRAIIDQRLDFDLGTLYRRVSDYFAPVKTEGHYNTAVLPKLKNALEVLDRYLSHSVWIAGDDFTIADVSAIVTVSSLAAIGFKLTPYLNIELWLKTAEQRLPGYEEVNMKGARAFRDFIFEKLKHNPHK